MLLVIYGAGGLGREIYELANIANKKEQKWDRIVFAVDQDYLESAKNKVNEIEVLAINDCLDKKYGDFEIALGQGEPTDRIRLIKYLEEKNVKFATIIHPDTFIPESSHVGKGCIIQNQCFISCNVRIEDHVYIQPKVNIGHDDVLGKGCILSGMANLGGHVEISKFSFIGMSAVLKEDVKIGDNSIIGMASAVYKNVPDGMVAIGNPARPITKNDNGFIFKH